MVARPLAKQGRTSTMLPTRRSGGVQPDPPAVRVLDDQVAIKYATGAARATVSPARVRCGSDRGSVAVRRRGVSPSVRVPARAMARPRRGPWRAMGRPPRRRWRLPVRAIAKPQRRVRPPGLQPRWPLVQAKVLKPRLVAWSAFAPRSGELPGRTRWHPRAGPHPAQENGVEDDCASGSPCHKNVGAHTESPPQPLRASQGSLDQP
jgi:hypothetical protein